MSTELDLGFSWLTSTLSGDATLAGYAPGGVSRTFAEPKTPTPYVIMSYQQGTDQVVFGGGRAYSDLHFQVSVVGPVSDNIQALENAAARVDALLTVAQQTAVTGGTILASFRTQPISTDTLVDGEVWNEVGGVYCLLVKGS